MDYKLYNIDGKQTSSTIKLEKKVFGIEQHKDSVYLAVKSEMAASRQGTSSTKTRGEVRGGGVKPYRQKGTGRARRGNLKTNILRGGGVTHGPVLRSHTKKLPKKVRKLGLKTALSLKEKEKKIIILDNLNLDKVSTKKISIKLKKLGVNSALLIDTNKIDKNFKNSIFNLHKINLIPSVGLNVYDVLKFNNLIFTKAGLEEVEKRLL